MEQDAVEHVQDAREVCGLKSRCQSCEVLAIAVEYAVRPDKETCNSLPPLPGWQHVCRSHGAGRAGAESKPSELLTGSKSPRGTPAAVDTEHTRPGLRSPSASSLRSRDSPTLLDSRSGQSPRHCWDQRPKPARPPQTHKGHQGRQLSGKQRPHNPRLCWDPVVGRHGNPPGQFHHQGRAGRGASLPNEHLDERHANDQEIH